MSIITDLEKSIPGMNTAIKAAGGTPFVIEVREVSRSEFAKHMNAQFKAAAVDNDAGQGVTAALRLSALSIASALVKHLAVDKSVETFLVPLVGENAASAEFDEAARAVDALAAAMTAKAAKADADAGDAKGDEGEGEDEDEGEKDEADKSDMSDDDLADLLT